MTIAEKYAAQFMPNGEGSLADLIQAAINEALSDNATMLDEAHEIIDQYKGMAARYKSCMDERDALRKDADKWRDLCSRVGADPSGTISYAGPLEGAPEDWAAIAREKGE